MSNTRLFAESDFPSIVYLTIGIGSIADTGSDTARCLWQGVVETATAHRCNLLLVVTGDDRDGARTCVHELVSPETADGFLAWIYRNDEAMESYLARFISRPLQFINMAHAGIPAVVTVSRTGLAEVVHHLVEEHGFRKLAFIRGPDDRHQTAQERFVAFRALLDEYGLRNDERMWSDAPGTWMVGAGVAGVECLLDRHGLRVGDDVEAIVCASDWIALGAMQELGRRGITVPGQVAVTGFNSMREACCNVPSITSVFNTCQAQAEYVTVNLLRMIGLDLPRPDRSVLDTQIVHGETCGCENPHVRAVKRRHAMRARWQHSAGADLDVLHRELEDCMLRLRLPRATWPRRTDELIRAFSQAVETGKPEKFYSIILPEIRVGSSDYMDHIHWLDVVTVFAFWAVAGNADPERKSVVEYVADMVRVMICDYQSRRLNMECLDEAHLAVAVRQAAGAMVTAENIEGIMRCVAGVLPPMGVTSCWLACYDDAIVAGENPLPETARLHLAMDDGLLHRLPAEGFCFPAKQIIPAGFLDQGKARTLILFPLVHGDDELGYVVYGLGPLGGDLYSSLAEAISAALQAMRQREAMRGHAEALERSQLSLQAAQHDLFAAEKMASLGELVASVVHEINTPIGICVTVASTLDDEAKAIARGAGPAMTIESYAESLNEGMQLITRNLSRASELMASFRQVAADRTSDAAREIQLKHYLQDILRSISPQLRKTRLKVEVECSSALTLWCVPGAIAQIITNFVMNSIMHGFEHGQSGLIRIDCAGDDKTISIHYSDNGNGMSMEVLGKVYERFFTTKAGHGGTGLGMHIVHSLVTQTLQGSIETHSEPGHGVSFRIVLPRRHGPDNV